MDSYPNQRNLLLYLAIFKYYGNLNLSEKHSKEILGPYFGGVHQTLYENLSEQAQYFVRGTTKSDEGFGSYPVLEITSKEIARWLVQKILQFRDKSLVEAIIELINDVNILKQRFLKDKIESDIKHLMMHRI